MTEKKKITILIVIILFCLILSIVFVIINRNNKDSHSGNAIKIDKNESKTKDTNSDGITDYYTKKLCNKELLLSDGSSVFCDLSYEDVQASADVDNDGLLNGDEIIIKDSDDTGEFYVELVSDPLLSDSDNDGYNDNEDLAPMKTYKNPIILIHGRADNTSNTFGACTNIQLGDNDHYDASLSKDGDDYTIVKTHYINNIKEGKLAEQLIEKCKYEPNVNLFAFNYPNQDFNQFNAAKLDAYIKNLLDMVINSESDSDIVTNINTSYDKNVKNGVNDTNENKNHNEQFNINISDIFATKSDMDSLNARFIIIGHSNGGLVSRYYIENLGGSKYVDRLITIDTPHYGSLIAYASMITDIADIISEYYPLDIELQPDSSLFGGQIDNYSSYINEKKVNYINNNQSPALKGNNSDTKYYAIAGYDVSYFTGEIDYISSKLKNKVFGFEITRNLDSKSSFNNAINDELEKYSNDNCGEVSEIYLTDISGDNVVDTMSQLGTRFSLTGNLESSVDFEKTAFVIDTNDGHSVINHFHGDILNEDVMMSYVLKYIKD